MNKQVCVIGAGPSGMCLMFHVDRMKRAGLQVPEVVCYEKQADWGGLWNYDWRTGTDEFGEPVHGSMYHNLWTNSPKEGLEFPDYTFEDHFKKPIPSYPPRSVITDYLKGRCNQSGRVKEGIEFRKVVKSVVYNADTDDFTVVVKDLAENVVLPKKKFDFVVICSGHFSVPNVPTFEGLESFTGRIMHAHDFRDAREFCGKRILIIGARKSAEDIAMQCVKYGSGNVICTYRTKPMGYKWPSQISEKPVPTHFVGNVAYFNDGSKIEVDAIIMCTGYLNHFPFMEDSLRMTGETTLYPPNLYKGTVWTAGGNNKVLYVGMQEPVYSYTMFDVQALWGLHYITGKLSLPNKKAMEENIELWTERKQNKVHNIHDAIDYQTDFVGDLSKDVALEFDLDVADIYHIWENHKNEDILTYRDRSFASKFTGTQAPLYHTTFMKAFDDTLQSFANFDK